MSNMQLITSSVNKKISFASVWKESFEKIPKGSEYIIAIFIFAMISMGYSFIGRGTHDREEYFAGFIIVSFLILIICLIVWNGFINAKNSIILSDFAKDNKFKFVEVQQTPIYSGSIFNVGNNLPVMGTVYGKWSEKLFEFFNHMYVVREGRSSATYTCGVIVIKLPRKVPNVLLASKETGSFGGREKYKSSQRLELEGDFNKYFDVFVPKNYERDLLYFMTPELMAILVDHAKEFDVEVIEDDLFIYKFGGFNFEDVKTIEEIFKLIGSVGGEFSENVDKYEDERMQNTAGGVIHTSGSRLARKTLSFMTIISISIYLSGLAYIVISVLIDGF